MKKQKTADKKPMSHEAIYKVMLTVTLVVSSAFFAMNLLKGNGVATLVIGVTVTVFVGINVYMKRANVSLFVKQLVVCLALCLIVFTISLFSGASYSDDFPLYLAVIGMTGLYMEPKFTKIQIVLIEVLLILMYVIHPEKAGSASQYFLCYAMFTVGAVLFYQTIKRGRAFREISEESAKEAQKLLASIREMGDALDSDFTKSLARIDESTVRLRSGSDAIVNGAKEAFGSCEMVQEKISETKEQITLLNGEVRSFEEVLTTSKDNMAAVEEQVTDVGKVIRQADSALSEMEEQMRAVAKIAGQLNSISFDITILSLNASIEAAKAGNEGAGFNVVAMRMRELSESSNAFSEKVAEIIEQLSKKVEETTKSFAYSNEVIARSESFLKELSVSFEELSEQFTQLYETIGNQSASVASVDSIFRALEAKVEAMRSFCQTNEESVEEISETMDVYKESIHQVILQTKSV